MLLTARGPLLLVCLALETAGNHQTSRSPQASRNPSIASSLLTSDCDGDGSSCASGLMQMHAKASLATKKNSSSQAAESGMSTQDMASFHIDVAKWLISHPEEFSAIQLSGSAPIATAPAANVSYPSWNDLSEEQREKITAWIPKTAAMLKMMKRKDIENMFARFMERPIAERMVTMLFWGYSHPPSSEWDRQKLYFWWALAICLPGTLLLQAVWEKLSQAAKQWAETSPETLAANSIAEGPVAPSQEKVFWPHLNGLRFLLALWVFCSHCGGMPVFGTVACNGTPEDCAGQAWFNSASLVALVTRGYVAVNAFMILAGFMTEVGFWKADAFLKPVDAFRFLKSRLITILPGYWVALTLLIYLQESKLVATPFSKLEAANFWAYLKCYLLVETWPIFKFEQLPLDQPTSLTVPMYGPYGALKENVPFWRTIHLWFVSSLFFSMVLAPALHNFLHLLRGSKNRHIWLALAMFLSGFLMNMPSMLAYNAYGVDLKFPLLNRIESCAITTWPQFFFGMCTGALLQERASAWKAASSNERAAVTEVFLTVSGDACFVAVILGTMWIPTYSFSVMGGEIFWLTGMGTVLALGFYFTCHPGCGKGLVHHICGSQLLAKLGDYSFHIFLLHVQVNEVVFGLTYGFPVPMTPKSTTRFLAITFTILLGLSVFLAEVTSKLTSSPKKQK